MLQEPWLQAVIVLSIGLALTALIVWWSAYLYRQRLMSTYFKDSVRFPSPESKFAVVDGIKLHYVVEGKGSNLLLVHGIGANIYCWRYLLPLLSKHFRVWAVDLKGFGLSDKPRNSNYGLGAQAALLTKFLGQQGVRQCTVVGNSMGGAIASEMAIQKSGMILDLVLINSAHDPRIVGRLDLRKVKYFVDFMSPFINRTLVKKFLQQLYGTRKDITIDVVDAYLSPYMHSSDTSYAFVSSFDALIDDTLMPRLKGLKKRVLILCGKNDRLVPLRFGQELSRLMPAATFLVHPEAGHHMQEEDPHWIAGHIHDFVHPK